MLFEEPTQPFECQSEGFYKPKIMKVEVTVEGIPNQLYAQGMRPYQAQNEVRKLMAVGIKRHPEVAMVAKDPGLYDCDLGKYLTEKFALWLDLRSTDDDGLHCNGRRIENASEGSQFRSPRKRTLGQQ